MGRISGGHKPIHIVHLFPLKTVAIIVVSPLSTFGSPRVLTNAKKRRRECPTVAELLLLLMLQHLLPYVHSGSQLVNDDFRLRSGYKPHITYVERTHFRWRHHFAG